LEFYSASSLKQQSTIKCVTLLDEYLMITNQPVFALTPKLCVIRGESTNTNFNSLYLIQTGA